VKSGIKKKTGDMRLQQQGSVSVAYACNPVDKYGEG
jgi:hypothetical protein